jgi:hypothetical protein
MLQHLLELALIIVLVGIIGAFSLLLIEIRYPLLEMLIAVFNPYVVVGMVLLKWFWREPKRFKEARGVRNY